MSHDNAPRAERVRAAGPERGALGGGLSHTKQVESTCISLMPNCIADRRVKRLRRSVWASGHLHGFADAGHRPPVCWFVTLTYAPGIEWSARHVSEAIRRFRNWCKAKGYPCRYTWVAELQQRGAVHYHLLAWLPPGASMRHWDRSTGKRHAFWPHGMTNTEQAKSGVGYLMKYLSKLGELSRFPKGLRLYGIGGLTKDARTVRAWYNLPGWAKRSYGVGQLCRKAVGLVVRETGELLPPAFRVKVIPDGLEFIKLRDVPQRFTLDQLPPGFAPGAYSAWDPT